MKFSNLKGIKLKWYHIVVFCLPGGMFLVTALIAAEMRKEIM